MSFNQIDISLQEAGHGDTTINKKMKNYVSIFHSIIKKVDYWESLKNEEKTNFFSTFFEHSIESSYFVEYFEKYRNFLTNNTLNHFTKGVISHKFKLWLYQNVKLLDQDQEKEDLILDFLLKILLKIKNLENTDYLII